MSKNTIPALIIDSEKNNYENYIKAMNENGISVYKICRNSRECFDLLLKSDVSIIIFNINNNNYQEVNFLTKIKEIDPSIPVIVISINADAETAVFFMKSGAFDFISNPDTAILVNSIKRGLELNPVELNTVNGIAEKQSDKIKNEAVFSKIITANEKMKAIFRYIEAISNSNKAVLITGESGTGKELIAKAIHDISRKQHNFVAVNVAGLDDAMFSDSLFGHKKGAFTGASENRKGLIVHAAHGTLFLDEIGDLEGGSQVKLLRLLQENEYYSLGSDIPEKTNVRIIASTNADLNYLQEKGNFRSDLYYRLNSHHIYLPPLKERTDDIPLLTEHFAKDAARSLNKKTPLIPDKLYPILIKYQFKGNIRELQSMVYDAVSRTAGDILDIDFFNDYIKMHSREIQRGATSYIGGDCTINYSGRFPSLEEIDDFFITEALKKSKGNQSVAAQLLGVSQSTLSRHLRKKFG